MTDQQSDASWNSLPLTAAIPRPDVKRISYTNGANWSETQADCLRKHGINAHEVSGGFAVDGVGDSDAYLIASWTCATEYPVDVRDGGYLTPDQVLYMYDFWANRLAPCLKLLGYQLAPTPTRDQFVQGLASSRHWTPYNTVDGQPLVDSPEQWRQIDLRCPPLPADYWNYEPLAYLHALSLEGTGGLR